MSMVDIKYKSPNVLNKYANNETFVLLKNNDWKFVRN